MILGAASFSASHRRVVRIEQAQDVALEPAALELGELGRVRPEVVGQFGHVGRPAGRVTDRIQVHDDAIEARLAVEARPELDDLGVDGRPGVADRLDVELPELAIATGLWPVVAEHRPDLAQLHRLRPGLHPVLDVGTDDAGGRLGTERPGLAVLGPRGEAEELLLDDVGDLADAALEDVGQLEHRRLDPPVAIAGGEVGGEPLEARPGRRFGRQQVAGPARGSEGGHRREPSRGRAGR